MSDHQIKENTSSSQDASGATENKQDFKDLFSDENVAIDDIFEHGYVQDGTSSSCNNNEDIDDFDLNFNRIFEEVMLGPSTLFDDSAHSSSLLKKFGDSSLDPNDESFKGDGVDGIWTLDSERYISDHARSKSSSQVTPIQKPDTFPRSVSCNSNKDDSYFRSEQPRRVSNQEEDLTFTPSFVKGKPMLSMGRKRLKKFMVRSEITRLDLALRHKMRRTQLSRVRLQSYREIERIRIEKLKYERMWAEKMKTEELKLKMKCQDLIEQEVNEECTMDVFSERLRFYGC